MKSKKEIFIGKRSKWFIRVILIILFLFFFEWSNVITSYILFLITHNPSSFAYTLKSIPIILVMMPLFINVAVRVKSFWSVNETHFDYHDNRKINFIQKCHAVKELFIKGYFTTNAHHYSYDEISHVTLYYKQRLFYGGYITHPLYFKIHLCDGTYLDAPFMLGPDSTKVYDAFMLMEEHGVYIEDEYNLLPLLKNKQRLDERMMKK